MKDGARTEHVANQRCSHNHVQHAARALSARRVLPLLLLLFTDCVLAQRIYLGEVVHIEDGNTLTILVDGQTWKIRLSDIDAPELGQPFGEEANRELTALALNKKARVVEVDSNSEGSIIGRVYVDDMDINAMLVRRGYAWVSRKHSKDTALYRLERKARDRGRGLWADEGSVPPWQWREGRHTSREDIAKEMIVGDAGSKVYHPPGCEGHAAIAPDQRVLFGRKEEAEDLGYRLAANCVSDP